jgi:hypothetical protein
MSPPIREGSGSSIGSIRLGDGSEISEVRTGAGDVLFSAIPDSAVVQYNAKELTGFVDGDTVSTRPDQTDTLDLNNGSGTYRSSGLNGNPTVDYDNQSDEHFASGTTISQKFVVYVVVDANFSSSTNLETVVAGSGNTDTNILWNGSNTNWSIFAGVNLAGTNDASINLLTAVFDGTNSVIREDGSQTNSGDAGTNDLDLLSIGENQVATGRHFDGDIPFVEVHDGNVSNGLQTREQQIADKFGITI